MTDYKDISLSQEENLEEEFYESRELYEQWHFVADPGQTLLRIDKFLVAHIANVSRSRIQDAADSGMIIVNGNAVKSISA